ncbi:receptor kinase-like protein Xa21 [Ananas comosus]|uniref:non-specific serine/threonine protein kinase n=1 Tax=Ananas comosus TaxID=4615 RepID=A0A6P5FY58_ANACO|nr:receptor kinase-like protein Xa21 [Ananas comosus]
MDFSTNKFSGNIPSALGNLQMLTYLNLSSNSFTGPIPESLGGLISINSLDLSSNALVGTIPKSLTRLHYLVNLNLSYNQLQGEIPQGGAFDNLTAESFMGNTALCGGRKFGLPPCTTTAGPESRIKRNLLKFLLPTIAAVVIFSAGLLLLLMFKRKKIKTTTTVNQLDVKNHRRISYQELIYATDNFNETNLLGSGSFGLVYKGRLDDGLLVAIKILNLQSSKASASFDAECEVLSTAKHRNLVKIISTCSSPEVKALILQYMPQGSLEKWLYSHNYYLNLNQRIHIMMDVALALEYLHHHCPIAVVHCDLKPGNILMGENLSARLSDFGISRLLSEDDSCAILTSTPGTIGYMAPEYGQAGKVSTSGDVYSYGILLLETFSRKKPTDEMFAGESSLRRWVSESFPNAIENVVDKNLLKYEVNIDAANGDKMNAEAASLDYQCLLSLLELGISCSRESPKERPTMEDVVVRLKKIRNHRA